MMLPMTTEGPSLKDTQLRISVTSLGKEKKRQKRNPVNSRKWKISGIVLNLGILNNRRYYTITLR